MESDHSHTASACRLRLPRIWKFRSFVEKRRLAQCCPKIHILRRSRTLSRCETVPPCRGQTEQGVGKFRKHQEPVSPTLLSGYGSFHGTMTFAVRKYPFHEPFLAYALRARSYLAYGSYQHGVTHLCST